MDRLTQQSQWTDTIDLSQELGYKHIYQRLAEYEDTGLTPAEVAELARAKHEFSRLQQENEQLKELLRLAVEDMRHCVADTGCEVCGNKSCKGFDDCEYEFAWQHADKMKGLVEI